jgi:hypothetical protein
VYAWNNTKCEISLQIPVKDYPEGIGFDNLIPLNKLSLEQRDKIIIRERDGFSVGTIRLKAPATWQANLVLLQKDGSKAVEVLTLFPGTFAPPFPDTFNVGTEEFHRSTDFWSGQVFIIPE